MKKIAIFASGRGSNAQTIIAYFQAHQQIEVALIVSNKKQAGVLEIANAHNIPSLLLSKDTFYHTNDYLSTLATHQIDLIVLAGFLWLIPPYLVQAYPNKIVNIHPALLPKYGGKGMYGMNVHRAVHQAKEQVSGISIHYVNEKYDDGNIIFQANCQLSEIDTPEIIAKKVLKLEHQYFAKIIEKLLLNHN